MSKLVTAGVFATGYVLGAKAGRERYEEIRRAWERATHHPRIKEIVVRVEDRAMNIYNDTTPSDNGSHPANRTKLA